jgi:hypothetical protein
VSTRAAFTVSLVFWLVAVATAPGCTGDDTGATGACGGDLLYGWHTFWGLAAEEHPAVAADDEGNVYVTGGSITWDGPNGESPLHGASLAPEPFVYKLDANGAYLWHTFCGDGAGRAIAVAEDGGVYVAGYSSNTWDGPGGQPPLNPFPQTVPPISAFVLHLEADGAYAWHAFFGGQVLGAAAGYSDVANSIVMLEGGDFVVLGSSLPWVGPSGEAPLHPHAGDDPLSDSNVFAVRLDPDGTYVWHTFYPIDFVEDAAGDGDGVYVSGAAAAWNGPNGEAPVDAIPDGSDAGLTVLKIGADGGYRWHTFYGPAVSAGSLTATEAGVFVAGSSESAWDGPSGEGPLHAFSGDRDEFVLALDGDGGYRWHTFHGGATGGDGPDAIAAGECGELYVTGWSQFAWNGPDGEPPLAAVAADAYNLTNVLALGADGTYAWHAFFATDGIPTFVDSCFAGGALVMAGRSQYSWNGASGAPPVHDYASAGGGYEYQDWNTVVLKLAP